MNTADDMMEFRRHFILLVQDVPHVISPWHIDTILNVSNSRRYRWPLHIFQWLETVIKKYQLKNNKSCEGCMFALLVLYFQKLKHGKLKTCQEPEPWLAAWTATVLSAMDCGNTSGNDGGVVEGRASSVTMNPGLVLEESDKGGGVRYGSVSTGAPPVASDGDDEDDEPIAKRLRRNIEQIRTPELHMTKGDTGTTNQTDTRGSTKRGGVSRGSVSTKAASVASDKDHDDDDPVGKILRRKTQLRQSPQHHMMERDTGTTSQAETTEQPTVPADPEPKIPSTALVQYSGDDEYFSEFFDRQVNDKQLCADNMNRDPECQKLWVDIERHYSLKPINMDPIQTIFPKGSSCRTPNP
ncbi:hypothetical protein HN51_061897 [Arachis hypogaea]